MQTLQGVSEKKTWLKKQVSSLLSEMLTLHNVPLDGKFLKITLLVVGFNPCEKY